MTIDSKEGAHLAVEVVDSALGPFHNSHYDIFQLGEPLGHEVENL
jgi:hypothetical protein